MFSILSTVVLLALPAGGPHRLARRPALRPLFGAAVSWGRPQPKREVSVAKNFCRRLRGRTLPPTKRELKASRPIPEWPMLRWKMDVSHVRGAFARAGWPVWIHCFSKTGAPYLKLRRVLRPGIFGVAAGPWQVTLYFRWAAPAGLSGILVERQTAWDVGRQRRFVKAVLSAYGATAKRIRRVSRREVYEEFLWVRPGTKIRFMMRRNRKTGKLDIWFRYVPGR